MDIEKSASCCFTGHRTMSDGEKHRASEEIKKLVRALVKKGVTNFIAGGALGFDTVAAVTVLNMRDNEVLTDADGNAVRISLTVAIPCPTQSAKWALSDRVLYNRILSSADEVVTLCESYTRDCMFIRNRYMVDKSAYCICYVTHSSGGSYYTMNYATKSGLGIINIAPSAGGVL